MSISEWIYFDLTILAVVGDFKDFAKAEQLAAWTGLVPAVHQSDDKLFTAASQNTVQGMSDGYWSRSLRPSANKQIQAEVILPQDSV